MTLFSLRQSRPRCAAGLGACVAMAIAAAALAAGCGGSSKAATASGSGRSVQVLATVRRGDLVDSVAGRLQLTSARSKAAVKGVVQVMGQNGSQVAAGQSVTVVFVQRPSGAGQGGFGQGYGSGQSGAPSARPSGIPSGGSGGGYGYGGQGLSGQGGQGGQAGQGAFRGKIAQGTVTAVSAGSNGSVTAMVTIAKLPSGVTAKYMGIAQIEVKVLASNVLLIPTAAVKGSGSSATVQLLASGKTSTQNVVVGQQAGGESEITSGLSEGQNVVYLRTFTGRFPGGFRNGQSPFGQGGAQSGGSTQNGTQSNGAASGT
jgi:membrane fusion protein, macrolide-specific efflux system